MSQLGRVGQSDVLAFGQTDQEVQVGRHLHLSARVEESQLVSEHTAEGRGLEVSHLYDRINNAVSQCEK